MQAVGDRMCLGMKDDDLGAMLRLKSCVKHSNYCRSFAISSVCSVSVSIPVNEEKKKEKKKKHNVQFTAVPTRT